MTQRPDADEQPIKRPDSTAFKALRQLLVAVAGGCTTSFARLYERTHRRVFGIVLRIVRRRAEAEEVLQDVYVKVWLHSLQFDANRGMANYWLASIAYRARPSTRGGAPRIVRTKRTRSWKTPIPTPPLRKRIQSPRSRRSQTRRLVQTQLQALPPDRQESLMLAFIEGPHAKRDRHQTGLPTRHHQEPGQARADVDASAVAGAAIGRNRTSGVST